MSAVMFMVGCVLWVVLWLLPAALLLAALYYVLSLPLRRMERARLFLDLVETSLESGQAPERALVSMSASQDPALDARFHWLAALLEMGRPLGEALGEVPRFLPPRVVSMLRVGLELGDLRRVLPACRHQLRDGLGEVQGAMNYVMVLGWASTPMFPVMMLMLAVFVFPKLRAILQDMEAGMPPMLDWFLANITVVAVVSIGELLLLLVAAVLFIGGPHLARRCNVGGLWLADRTAWWLPWKRARLRRDFVALLAVLLDGGVPEAKAVELAAAGVDNAVLRKRAEAMVSDLKQGRGLREALGRLDEASEFAWRLGNVEASRAGFGVALAGWLESLDARAFRVEQATAHVVTTGLVLTNGVVVGVVVVATFQVLIQIVNAGVLW